VVHHRTKNRWFCRRSWFAALVCGLAVFVQMAGAPLHHLHVAAESHRVHPVEIVECHSSELAYKLAASPAPAPTRDHRDHHDESHCNVCQATAQARLALVTVPDSLNVLTFEPSWFGSTTQQAVQLPLSPTLLGLLARGPPATV